MICSTNQLNSSIGESIQKKIVQPKRRGIVMSKVKIQTHEKIQNKICQNSKGPKFYGMVNLASNQMIHHKFLLETVNDS